ncbi:hypothetical protein PTSG_06569 [Salpingoeca rosetta]|uniref:Uncharacterized protein n=1 Tax=Salpingoeca rosetta (strain ATCC 50818 / BSB-021) TaxID=946362 RepID=F2UG66_SALR5|nr:uncharacterized protein PTSG_06569 [Salpingoeca rosetta]EGD75494.1 hypothetical protein PTSG_06569 [Salpingoeca rosetta]|eukprot:XP_004991951.1 hypothetical protein PTSG_06569 [Salpingoeca rosetta]
MDQATVVEKKGALANVARHPNAMRMSFRECSTVLMHKKLGKTEEGTGDAADQQQQQQQQATCADGADAGARKLTSSQSSSSSGGLVRNKHAEDTLRVALEDDPVWKPADGADDDDDEGDEDDAWDTALLRDASSFKVSRFSQQPDMHVAEDNDDDTAEADAEAAKAMKLALGVYPWQKPDADDSGDDNDDDDDDDADGAHQEEPGLESEQQQQEQQQQEGGSAEQQAGDDEEVEAQAQDTDLSSDPMWVDEPDTTPTGTGVADEATATAAITTTSTDTAPPGTVVADVTVRRISVTITPTGAFEGEVKHLYERVESVQVPCVSKSGATVVTMPVCCV